MTCKLNVFKKKESRKYSNGPGTALRQENSFSNDSFDNGNKITSFSEFKPTAISSTTLIATQNTMVTVSGMSNPKTNTNTISSDDIKPNKPNLTSSIYTSNNEDLVKCEKFKAILGNNPINLEELQNASWKGIPKSFRPICWKLLSVC